MTCIVIYVFLCIKEEPFQIWIVRIGWIVLQYRRSLFVQQVRFPRRHLYKNSYLFEEEETLSMVSKIEDITYTELYDALLENKNVTVPDEEPLCKKPSTAISREKQISIQQDQVLNRMQNYENILKLQKGKLSLDDIEDIYFNNNKPSEIKNAVKSLSQLSKEGNVFRFTRKRPPSRARTAAQDTKRRRSLSAPPLQNRETEPEVILTTSLGFIIER